MSKQTRIAIVAAVAAIAIAAIVVSIWSPEVLDALGNWLELAIGAVAGGGITAAVMGRRGGSAAAVLLVAMLAAQGCELPPPQSAGDSRCRWEAAAVEATGAAVAALGELAPESEEAERAIATAQETVELGRSSVRLCHHATDRPRWWAWAGEGLRTLSALMGILKAAGVPIPDEIRVALSVVSTVLGVMTEPSSYTASAEDPAGDPKTCDCPTVRDLSRATEALGS